MDVVILLGVLILAASFLGSVLAYGLSSSVPPENRPMPPERTADIERARDEALRKLAERNRRQDQREASARISRGV